MMERNTFPGKILHFLKSEAVLVISLVLAAASMFLVPPDAAYAEYVNFEVLGLLLCLMAAVAGLRQAGLFELLAKGLTRLTRNGKVLGLLLTAACFVLSAFVTNDVALITFVPFTVALLGTEDRDRLIGAVVMETVAANLGSLSTPIGNPQNLLIYDTYGLGAGEFFSLSLPVAGLCLVFTAVASLLVLKRGADIAPAEEKGGLQKFPAVRAAALFILCVLTVLRVLDWKITLAVTLLALMAFDRKLFGKIDWGLLVTFVGFFVFVGNLARVEAVRGFVEMLLEGRVMVTSALISQVVSNVPAAAMLTAFTEDWRGVFLGVNLGGLGTLIASMASLISYRLYGAAPKAAKGRYMAIFTLVNFALLAVLLVIANLIW